MQWLGETSGQAGQMASGLRNLYPPLTTVWSDLRYLTYLIRDMGLFCGLAARNYFDNLIANRCAKISGKDPSYYHNLPFSEHHRGFGSPDGRTPGPGKDLMVCSANISIGKAVLFSCRPEHTPFFPVADAVRMSMSLPIVYKPYVIKESMKKWPPCGTYVDGGIWNNIPLREVDPTHQVTNTLSLRLSIDQPSRVESIYDVFGSMLNNAVSTGESQVLSEFSDYIIALDTRDLDLLKFQPDDKTKTIVTKHSRRIVREFFKWPKDNKDSDPADEAMQKKIRGYRALRKLGLSVTLDSHLCFSVLTRLIPDSGERYPTLIGRVKDHWTW